MSFHIQGIEWAKKAAHADGEGRLDEAFRGYELACSWFMKALEHDRGLGEHGKAVIRDKIKEYLARAEEIKEHLDASKSVSRTTEPASEIVDSPPTLMLTARPDTRWGDVAGLERVKRELKDAVVVPRQLPHFFEGHKRRAPKGILLYGPPGTGKTLVARALAGEANLAFFAASTSDIMAKYVGESEQRVRALFEDARAHRPAIIFIDEIDALCGDRDSGGSSSDVSSRVVNEFLNQLQGLSTSMDGILLLGATNRPQTLDSAMRRRFDKKIYVSLPSPAVRSQILRLHLKDVPSSITDEELQTVVDKTNMYSPSDLEGVVQHALNQTLHMVTDATHFRNVSGNSNEYIWTPCSPADPNGREVPWQALPAQTIQEPPVTLRHILAALDDIKPNVSVADCQIYEAFTAEHGIES